MKIYEIGTGYTPIPACMGAATEIVVEELTKSLTKNEYDVEILDISTKKRADNSLPIREVKVPGFITKDDVSLGIMHKVKRVVYSVALARTLKKILRKSEDKVVLHFHNQYNMYFYLKLVPEKLRKKAVTLYTNHSYIWHGEWEEIKDAISGRYFQEIAAMKAADYVFVLNEQTKKNIAENIDLDVSKLHLIDNGVNTGIYHILEEAELADYKKKHNLQGKTVFVQVGSVCDRKNQLGAVELLCPFMKENKDIVYLYAGGVISPEYKQQIDDFAKEKGIEDQVVYFGELVPGAELNKFYNLASAMIFPSKAEGFSLVILEAMSAGVPVLIYDSLQFKLSDKCLKFKDADEFESIISTQILSDKRAELSANVRKAVVENYSWDIIAADYIGKI